MSGQRVGCQRVGSLEQNPQRQLDGIVLDQTCPDRLWAQTSTGRQLTAQVVPISAGDTQDRGEHPCFGTALRVGGVGMWSRSFASDTWAGSAFGSVGHGFVTTGSSSPPGHPSADLCADCVQARPLAPGRGWSGISRRSASSASWRPADRSSRGALPAVIVTSSTVHRKLWAVAGGGMGARYLGRGAGRAPRDWSSADGCG